MGNRIFRSFNEPAIRDGVDFDERWNGEDHGLITAWEVGRELRETKPDLAKHAENGALPELNWKGGVKKKLKYKKYGTLYYLAQWQGLRGEDLDIETDKEVTMTCSKEDQEVVYTADSKKWSKSYEPK